MEIIEKKQDEILIYQLHGRLDSNTSPEFEKRIDTAIQEQSHQVVIDCERLDYISSAGLRVVLKTAKALKRLEGKIVLCAMQDYVSEVFEISGFNTFLPIVPSLEDALSSVAQP